MRSYGAVTFALPLSTPLFPLPLPALPLASPSKAPPAPFILFFTHKPQFSSIYKIQKKMVLAQYLNDLRKRLQVYQRLCKNWINPQTHKLTFPKLEFLTAQRKCQMKGKDIRLSVNKTAHWHSSSISSTLPTLSLPLLPPMGEALSQAETRHSAEGEPLWSVTALLVHISSHFMLYEHQTETVNVF